jgi:predicted transglutaminase-like cysteine proteinase
MSWRDYSLLWATLAAVLLVRSADASSLTPPDPRTLTPIVESSPTLAPFQHVRFCLRYPADCRSSADQAIRIELNVQTMELLDRVNRDVNLSIIPRVKSYGSDLEDSWKIAPDMGDCNDYAVTKRHNLLESGLPASALRLSVIKTASGIGHLVLIVATTNGDIVMDNLTPAIRPWQATDYQWLKIQSASDPRYWSEIKSPGIVLTSQASRKLRVAGRLTN